MRNLLLIVLVLLPLIFYGQISIKNDVPVERIELTLSTNFLFAGQTLYFSISSFDQWGQSDLSKVALIEIINPEGESSFRTMTLLHQGKGYGNFEVPIDFETGNYNIIAYTNWMKNFPLESITKEVFTIINHLKPLPEIGTTSATDEIKMKSPPNDGVEISLSQKSYSQREKVDIEIESKEKVSLTISVRLKTPQVVSTVLSNKPTSPSKSIASHRILPELRGDLVSGRLTIDGEPLTNHKVFLTSKAKDYAFFASHTNQQGIFYFTTPGISTDEVLITYEPVEGKVKAELYSDYLTDHSGFKPTPLIVDSLLHDFIQHVSPSVSISNAYQKHITIPSQKTPVPKFYGQPDKIHLLDDYTRFVVMDEVIREYVGSVFLRKDEKGYIFRVRNFEKQNSVFQATPLVLMDGIPYLDMAEVMKTDPLKIEKIEIVGKGFIHGSLSNKGIVSFESYDGGLTELEMLSNTQVFPYDGLKSGPNFSRPDYEKMDDTYSRIADYSLLLHWEPHIEVNGKKTISFFTGDFGGEFDVTIKGYIEGKEPIQVSKTFKVEVQ